jgi:SAM-dependent methyltransferase
MPLHRADNLNVETQMAQALKDKSADEAATEGGYDPFFFDRLARIEDKHFWFRARNSLLLALTRRIATSRQSCRHVLEIGCGTGNVLRVLEKAFPNSLVVGMELWFEGLRYARRRSSAALVQGDIRNWPFGAQFDAVGMFDVLEHIPDDRGTLASIFGCLAPGGYLVLTVPAHQSLWSYFDEAAHHCRRYSSEDIRNKLCESGFEVEFLSPFMMCIFPLVWTLRKLRNVRARTEEGSAQKRADDEFRIIPVVNQLLAMLLRAEAAWVSRGHRLPVGTSLAVIARKPVVE